MLSRHTEWEAISYSPAAPFQLSLACCSPTRLLPHKHPALTTAGQPLPSGGPFHVSFPSGLTMQQIQRKNPLVVRGGHYRPPDCEARHRTAIIIPHRDREQHLRILLYYLHPFLQRQQIQYGIYVIHQVRRTASESPPSLPQANCPGLLCAMMPAAGLPTETFYHE